ncbi:MAG: NAD-binding protein [Gordonia sp. (in: high G+C Gram-positive bacteria)]
MSVGRRWDRTPPDVRASVAGGSSWGRRSGRPGARAVAADSGAVFVILRRMRTPLITIIAVFAIGTLGLVLIPGVDAAGQTRHLTFFDAFYVMSYTATTIGFGETPWPFTVAQQVWVVVVIYLSVVSWAYAIGTLLSLFQDRGLSQVRALQRFTYRVKRLREPFILLAGYGRAGELLVLAFDAMGQETVVIDVDPERIDELALGSFRADVPGLAADAGDPQNVRLAGLDSRYCAGVLALTGDDQVNLSIAMTVALLRPDLPIVSHTISRIVAEQMRAFGAPEVIDPFERFGNHLKLALNSPATYQLMTWLEAGPGASLPERGRPPVPGRWVVCGWGRLGQELTTHLRSAGVELTVIEQSDDAVDGALHSDIEVIQGDAGDPGVLASAHLDSAVGLVAGTDDDVTNLSALAGARRQNPDLYLAGRQNRSESAELFGAMELDALLVPSEVVAHEVYARISSPMLWRFLRRLPDHDEEFAEDLLKRLTDDCGTALPVLWKIRLEHNRTPAIMTALARGDVTLGDLLRRPEDRTRPLHVVPLLLIHGDSETLAPGMDVVLEAGDELLFAGGGHERRGLESTLVVDSTSAYVLSGERVPASAVWRALTRRRRARRRTGASRSNADQR